MLVLNFFWVDVSCVRTRYCFVPFIIKQVFCSELFLYCESLDELCFREYYNYQIVGLHKHASKLCTYNYASNRICSTFLFVFVLSYHFSQGCWLLNQIFLVRLLYYSPEPYLSVFSLMNQYDLRPRWPLGEEYAEGRSEARSMKTARIHPSLTSMIQASSQQQP